MFKTRSTCAVEHSVANVDVDVRLSGLLLLRHILAGIAFQLLDGLNQHGWACAKILYL